ncbi:hypothetical protein MKK68_01650 [Methylobacterium sp. E-016]|uniref:hypothetical protein n=1 Tax=Methylobacterium sp. E-016 TaxID=2836556 RepID=UPI001FB895DD|nr:hypothetical protein [Methylobacterium sp. E-016]MCJ2074366.1 hypothetical protein [Methylobacterium sp. E-016]
MNRAYPISVDDPAADCPVAIEVLGRLMGAEAETLLNLLEGIPEATRARLAVYLYGRSHTHELGIRIAATCERRALQGAPGLVGDALHDLSRKPYAPTSFGTRSVSSKGISLGGSHRVGARA